MNITINNHGTVNIYCTDEVSKAKDKLLERMYYARNSANIIGGREGWHTLLNMYYVGNYNGMKEFILTCRGRCGTRRKEMIDCLNIIIGGETL